MSAAPSIRDRIVDVRRVRAGDLLPHPMNPRSHPEPQRRAVSGSLASFGQVAPLIAFTDADGALRLVDGHLRASLHPDAEVKVAVTDLSPEEARAVLAVLDPSAALAEVDAELLASLQAMVALDVEAGLLSVSEDLDALLAEVAPPVVLQGGPDEIPEAVAARCKAGEVWECGKHRLAVADCTDPEVVRQLMAGERARLVCTDPPYAVDYVAKARDMNRRGYGHSRAKRGAAIAGDGIESGQEEGLWRSAFEVAFAEAAEENAAFYAWHAQGRAMLVLYNLLRDLGFLHHQTLIWEKPNFVIGRCDYQWIHEPCFYGWKQGHRPPFYGEKNQTTVWDVARDTQHPDHPTQKPVEVFTRPMRNHLKPGEVVYDPFAGSGTAIIAAEAVGVRAFCCEISLKHADTCLARWELATGQEAHRIP